MPRLAIVLMALTLILFNQKNYASTPVCQMKQEKLLCGDGEINHITHIGSLELNQTSVLQNLWLIGDLIALNASLNHSKITGKAGIKQSQFSKAVEISGDLDAKESVFISNVIINGSYVGVGNQFLDDVILTGDSLSNDDQFKKKITIQGQLEAIKSSFEDRLEVVGCSIKLNDSKANNIVMKKKSRCSSGEQKIHLSHHSVVNGDIVFKDGKGSVALSRGSVIKGRVIGGSVKYN